MIISPTFLRRSLATLVSALALQSASSYAAQCEYVIRNEWGGGFVAAIRITNDTSTAINGWSVTWRYTQGTIRTGGWNASISGSNPYTATGVGWNDRINPGQTIEFGVMGNKGTSGTPAERPVVMGAVCNGSSSSEQSSSSEASSSVESSSSEASSFEASSSTDFGGSSSDTFSSSETSSSETSSSETSSSESLSSATESSSVASSSEPASSSVPSSVASSSRSSSVSSEGPLDDHPLDNPFVGARWYVDPIWSAKARGEPGGEKVARFNTAVWMDRIGAIDPPEGFGLRDHLDAALEQGANLIQVVVYDLPNRDCHALASNGELDQGPEGTMRYRTEYVDQLAAIFSDPRYSNLRIIAIIEPDSLPNLVTNLSDPDCQLATDPQHGYVANTRYTLSKLAEIPNVYSYVDIGHSGWLGWEDNFGKAITLIGDAIKGTPQGVRSIAGFVSNTSGYTPIFEPFLDSLANSALPGSGGGTQVRQAKFYEWNPQFSEVGFVQAWRTRMIAAGFPSTIGMLIDTSRNGWGGPDRPTAQSTSTQLDTFVDESRVDRRIHRGNWCNQPGGIGERPQATPEPGIDAYVWVKPPGESDGASSLELSFDPLDPAKGFDRMCDPTYTRSEGNNSNLGTGALPNAPVAGRWFPEAFQLMVRNAYPALDDVPPSSSSASSSEMSSSGSSEASSAEASSSEASSSEASSSEVSSSTASSEIGAGSSESSSFAESSSSVESSSSETSSSSEESSSAQSSSEASSSTETSSSAQSSSEMANEPPVANLTVTVSGATVHVDASASVDADGDDLMYRIDFGDDTSIQYPEAWHSYGAAGSYTVTLTVSDGINSSVTTEAVEVGAAGENRAPVARLSVARSNLNVVAFGSTSFDADGDELTYSWDFGTGAMEGLSTHVFNDCESETANTEPRLVTLTVSDGELADTQQVLFNKPCGGFEEKITVAEFTSRLEGDTVFVDASASVDAVYFMWDFGDGTSGSGLARSHTYAEPGTYTITLTAYGPDRADVKTTTVTVADAASSSSSSSSEASSSSESSSSVSSESSSVENSSEPSSSSSSSSSAPAEPNTYIAPRAETVPVIDGAVDDVWERASWAPIDVFWLGTQPSPPASDYTGRYKALWDENYLYLLFDITDDRIYDHTRDPLSNYWEDDTVELFIDENKNGGQHQFNTSAWAYHVSTYGDNVDYTTSGPKLLNDHIDVRMVSNGDKHYWEMRVKIFGEDYADNRANTPLVLTAGKEMGFSASYIDNDGTPQRQSMMGSVDTPGHRNNQGYINASVFGTLRLVE